MPKSVKYNYVQTTNADYIDHLSYLSEAYISSKSIKVVKLPSASKEYLERIYWKIIKNNELFFEKKYAPKFYIIKERVPFYFSLPGGHLFFSTGIISKYFKNEHLFLSAITLETIRTNKGIYKKRILIPTGSISTEKILSLTRLPLDKKLSLNKWTFYAMKRSGFDPFALLIWIQTQNKNTLDFNMQQGDTRSLSREEFLFKNFIAKEGIQNIKNRSAVNSSKGFYKLTSFIKRRSHE